MNDILSKIIEHKKEELKAKKFYFPLTKFIKTLNKSKRKFKQAIRKPGLNIIAEIKKASPSQGIIDKKFNPIKIAQIYQKYAAAISVVTEEKFFQGKLEYLQAINGFSSVPLLRKDFIIDEYQIYESRHYGADAILLIASILEEKQIEQFLDLAKTFSLEVIVEIHSMAELEKVLRTKAEIIGINNRDLKTFNIDLQTTFNLAPHIPEDKIIVSESGIRLRKDLEVLKGNVNAVLIGTSLMKKGGNLEKTLKEWQEFCAKPVEKNMINKQLSLI